MSVPPQPLPPSHVYEMTGCSVHNTPSNNDFFPQQLECPSPSSQKHGRTPHLLQTYTCKQTCKARIGRARSAQQQPPLPYQRVGNIPLPVVHTVTEWPDIAHKLCPATASTSFEPGQQPTTLSFLARLPPQQCVKDEMTSGGAVYRSRVDQEQRTKTASSAASASS